MGERGKIVKLELEDTMASILVCLLAVPKFIQSIQEWDCPRDFINFKESFYNWSSYEIESQEFENAKTISQTFINCFDYNTICHNLTTPEKVLNFFLLEIHKATNSISPLCMCPACACFCHRGSYTLFDRKKSFELCTYFCLPKLVDNWIENQGSIKLEFHPDFILMDFTEKALDIEYLETLVQNLVCKSKNNLGFYDLVSMTLSGNSTAFLYGLNLEKILVMNSSGSVAIYNNLNEILQKYSPSILFFGKNTKIFPIESGLQHIFLNLLCNTKFNNLLNKSKHPHGFFSKLLSLSETSAFELQQISEIYDFLIEDQVFSHKNLKSIHSLMNALLEYMHNISKDTSTPCGCISCNVFKFSYQHNRVIFENYIIDQELEDIRFSNNGGLRDITMHSQKIDILHHPQILIFSLIYPQDTDSRELSHYLNERMTLKINAKSGYSIYHLFRVILQKNTDNEIEITRILIDESEEVIFFGEDYYIQDPNLEELFENHSPTCLFYTKDFRYISKISVIPIRLKTRIKEFDSASHVILCILQISTISAAKLGIETDSEESEDFNDSENKVRFIDLSLFWESITRNIYFTESIANGNLRKPDLFLDTYLSYLHTNSNCTVDKQCPSCLTFQLLSNKIDFENTIQKQRIVPSYIFPFNVHSGTEELGKCILEQQPNTEGYTIINIKNYPEILTVKLESDNLDSSNSFIRKNQKFKLKDAISYHLEAIVLCDTDEYSNLIFIDKGAVWTHIKAEDILYSYNSLQEFMHIDNYCIPKLLFFKQKPCLSNKIMNDYLNTMLGILVGHNKTRKYFEKSDSNHEIITDINNYRALINHLKKESENKDDSITLQAYKHIEKSFNESARDNHLKKEITNIILKMFDGKEMHHEFSQNTFELFAYKQRKFNSFFVDFLRLIHNNDSQCESICCDCFKFKEGSFSKIAVALKLDMNEDLENRVMKNIEKIPKILFISPFVTHKCNLSQSIVGKYLTNNDFSMRISLQKKIIEYRLKLLIFQNPEYEMIKKTVNKDNLWVVTKSDKTLRVQEDPFEDYEEFKISSMIFYKESYSDMGETLECLRCVTDFSREIGIWPANSKWGKALKKLFLPDLYDLTNNKYTPTSIYSQELESIKNEFLDEFISLNLYKQHKKNIPKEYSLIDLNALLEDIHLDFNCDRTCPSCKIFNINGYTKKGEIEEKVNAMTINLTLQRMSTKIFQYSVLSYSVENENIIPIEYNIRSPPIALVYTMAPLNDEIDFDENADNVLDFIKYNYMYRYTNYGEQEYAFKLKRALISTASTDYIITEEDLDTDSNHLQFDRIITKQRHTRMPRRFFECKLIFTRINSEIECFFVEFYRVLNDLTSNARIVQNHSEIDWVKQGIEYFTLKKTPTIRSLSRYYISEHGIESKNIIISTIIEKLFQAIHEKYIQMEDELEENGNQNCQCPVCRYFLLSVEKYFFRYVYQILRPLKDFKIDDKDVYKILSTLKDFRIDDEDKEILMESKSFASEYLLIYLDGEIFDSLQTLGSFFNSHKNLNLLSNEEHYSGNLLLNYIIIKCCNEEEQWFSSLSYNYKDSTFTILNERKTIDQGNKKLKYQLYLLIYNNERYYNKPIKLENNIEENLCYINSAIHATLSIKSFRNDIIAWNFGSKWGVELQKLINRSESNRIKNTAFHLMEFREYFQKDTNFFDKRINDQYNTEALIRSLFKLIHRKCERKSPCPICKNFLIEGETEMQNISAKISSDKFSIMQLISSESIKLHSNVLAIYLGKEIRFTIEKPPKILWIELKYEEKYKAQGKSQYEFKAELGKNYILSNSTIEYESYYLQYTYVLKSIIFYGQNHYVSITSSEKQNQWFFCNDANKEQPFEKLEDYVKFTNFYPSSLFYKNINITTSRKILIPHITSFVAIIARIHIFRRLLAQYKTDSPLIIALNEALNQESIDKNIDIICNFFRNDKDLRKFNKFLRVFLNKIHIILKPTTSSSCTCPICLVFKFQHVKSQVIRKTLIFRSDIDQLLNAKNSNNIISLSDRMHDNSFAFVLYVRINNDEEFNLENFIASFKEIKLANSETYEMNFFKIKSESEYSFYEKQEFQNEFSLGNSTESLVTPDSKSFLSESSSILVRSSTSEEISISEESVKSLSSIFWSENTNDTTIATYALIEGTPNLFLVESCVIVYFPRDTRKNLSSLITLTRGLFRSEPDIMAWVPTSTGGMILQKYLTMDKETWRNKSFEHLVVMYKETASHMQIGFKPNSISSLFLMTQRIVHDSWFGHARSEVSYLLYNQLLISDEIQDNPNRFVSYLYTDYLYSSMGSQILIKLKSYALAYHENAIEGLGKVENIPPVLVYSLIYQTENDKTGEFPIRFIRKNREIFYEDENGDIKYYLEYILLKNEEDRYLLGTYKNSRWYFEDYDSCHGGNLSELLRKLKRFVPIILLYKRYFVQEDFTVIDKGELIERTKCQQCKTEYPFYFQNCPKCKEESTTTSFTFTESL